MLLSQESIVTTQYIIYNNSCHWIALLINNVKSTPSELRRIRLTMSSNSLVYFYFFMLKILSRKWHVIYYLNITSNFIMKKLHTWKLNVWVFTISVSAKLPVAWVNLRSLSIFLFEYFLHNIYPIEYHVTNWHDRIRKLHTYYTCEIEKYTNHVLNSVCFHSQWLAVD